MVVALGAGLIVGQGATLYLFSLLLVPMQKELGWSRAELSGESFGAELIGYVRDSASGELSEFCYLYLSQRPMLAQHV